MNTETTEALQAARELLAAGVPLFIAKPARRPDGSWDPRGGTGERQSGDGRGCGYKLPQNWEQTPLDMGVLDRWQPGDALGAVGGHGIDFVDVDPRHGGDVKALPVPAVYAVASTPSGGWHAAVRALGVPKVEDIAPGVDIRAGRPDGTGRGFVFIAPTVKEAKDANGLTGVLGTYRWTKPLDHEFFAECAETDDSGAALADMVRAKKARAKKARPTATEGGGYGYPEGPIPTGSVHGELVRYVGYLSNKVFDRDIALQQFQSFLATYVPQITSQENRDWHVSKYFGQWGEWAPKAEQEREQRAASSGAWEAMLQAVQEDRAARLGTTVEQEWAKSLGTPAAAPSTSYVEPDEDGYAAAVAKKALDMRIADDARLLNARLKAGDVAMPPLLELPDLLARPDEEEVYLVQDLLTAQSKFLLAAQNKAGKTTLIGNLVRSMVDGAPFLGNFTVPKKLSRVVVIDDELGENMLRRWYRDLKIGNTAAVQVVPLRGRGSTFNLIDPATRAKWATMLRGADMVIFDCLRPVLDALGLDENREAGRFLEAFDELMQEAGIEAYGVVHHMGHQGERSRGDSRILDWADVIWNLRRATPANPEEPEDDKDVARFFSAYGRDVSVPEAEIHYSVEDRMLSYLPGRSRATAKAQVKHGRLSKALLFLLSENDELNVNAAREQLKRLNDKEYSDWQNNVSYSTKDVAPALLSLYRDGLLSEAEGPRGSKIYKLSDRARALDRGTGSTGSD